MVVVGFGSSAITGVEIIRDGGDLQHADIGGKGAVERSLEPKNIEGLIVNKVGDLPEGVHAGVGAAGPCNSKGGSQHDGQCMFEKRLNGGRIILDLPSAVLRSVVGKEEDLCIS